MSMAMVMIKLSDDGKGYETLELGVFPDFDEEIEPTLAQKVAEFMVNDVAERAREFIRRGAH